MTEGERPPRPTPPAADAGAGRRNGAPPGRPATPARGAKQPPGEVGGPKGPEPTRYGDWEKGGRCTDF